MNFCLVLSAHYIHWQTTHWLPVTPQHWYNLQTCTAQTNIIYIGHNWEKAGCCLWVGVWKWRGGEERGISCWTVSLALHCNFSSPIYGVLFPAWSLYIPDEQSDLVLVTRRPSAGVCCLGGTFHVDGGDSGHEAALEQAVRVGWLVVTV